MAVTIAIVNRATIGNAREVTADITGPASYTTGGETLTAAQQAQLFPELGGNPTLSFAVCKFFDAEVMMGTTPALLSCVLDKTNNKMVFTTAGAQTTAATNLSAQVVRAKFRYAPAT